MKCLRRRPGSSVRVRGRKGNLGVVCLWLNLVNCSELVIEDVYHPKPLKGHSRQANNYKLLIMKIIWIVSLNPFPCRDFPLKRGRSSWLDSLLI